jgi:hypothetical protein
MKKFDAFAIIGRRHPDGKLSPRDSSFSNFSALAALTSVSDTERSEYYNTSEGNVENQTYPAKALKLLKIGDIGNIAPLSEAFGRLERSCPEYVDSLRWRCAVTEGSKFMAEWGDKPTELGWTAADLFGLPEVPENPAPLFNRTARYDRLGLIWLLGGDKLAVSLSKDSATIQHRSGSRTTYRRLTEN